MKLCIQKLGAVVYTTYVYQSAGSRGVTGRYSPGYYPPMRNRYGDYYIHDMYKQVGFIVWCIDVTLQVSTVRSVISCRTPLKCFPLFKISWFAEVRRVMG